MSPTMQTDQAASAPYGEASFLGMPREIRDMVYKELFGVREEQGFEDRYPHILTDRVLAIDSLNCEKGFYPAQKNPNPAILGVNHQLRAEAGEVYYSKQDLYLDYEYSDVLPEILSWASMIVRDLAIYLRDVRVHIAALGDSLQDYVQFQQVIHLKFSTARGLTVEGWKGAFLLDAETDDQYQWVLDMRHLITHAAPIEAAREPDRQGGAIIDFFSHNQDRLRDACFGPPIRLAEYIDLEGESRVRSVPCHPHDRNILVTRKRFW